MTLQDKRILIIDDTSSIRAFLRISLEGHGAHLSEAATASEGLDLFRQNNPDLVVLDLGLPDRDGLDLLPDMVPSPCGSAGKMPVIVLTVRKDSRDCAMERGASAYMTKPFMMDDLLEVIEHHLPETHA